MSEAFRLSRRVFAGSALATLAMGTRALAADPPALTAESPIGPFYPVQHLADADADLTRIRGHARRALGEVIELSGRVLDRRGNPVKGAKLELWQANAAGRYAHPDDISTMPLDPDFQGYATIRTGSDGSWRLTTIKPGAYDSPIGRRSPHIHFDASGRQARNILQMYFPEDAPANAKDALYTGLGTDAFTSVAERLDAGRYRWDIVLLG